MSKLVLLKSRNQDFCLGRFLSPDGVKALGTGLLPAQLKGQARPESFKAEKAMRVLLQTPLMAGNTPLKEMPLCPSGEGDSSQAREKGTVAATRGEGTVACRTQKPRNPVTFTPCLVG